MLCWANIFFSVKRHIFKSVNNIAGKFVLKVIFFMSIAHWTLHTAHYTLHTAHCTRHTAHTSLSPGPGPSSPSPPARPPVAVRTATGGRVTLRDSPPVHFHPQVSHEQRSQRSHLEISARWPLSRARITGAGSSSLPLPANTGGLLAPRRFIVHFACCSLHTWHCTLYSILHTEQCTLHHLHCSLYTAQL